MRNAAILLLFLVSQSVMASDELVIVAKPLSASLSEKSCDHYAEKNPGSEVQEVCMDRVFDITYQVIEVIAGKISKGEIDVIDFYHYTGLPDHLTIDPACVTLSEKFGSYFHLQTDPAHRKLGKYSCVFTIE